ncbi:hypothetical protein AVEN_7178-1 [Araneus ventricosus]|uniref:Uncharacterized protein n=1 Tax=Araneus ventricosus TaxID=182803 RepID=A0A4Y2GQZ8_ARAVE|nr:hypothetical protein AVEN_7178-1 [Araneus ventricosus]
MFRIVFTSHYFVDYLPSLPPLMSDLRTLCGPFSLGNSRKLKFCPHFLPFGLHNDSQRGFDFRLAIEVELPLICLEEIRKRSKAGKLSGDSFRTKMDFPVAPRVEK